MYGCKCLCIGACVVWLAACGGPGAPTEITETRTVAPPGAAPAGGPADQSPEKMVSPHHRAFTWTVPEGWTAEPTTPMRQANFKVGPAPEAECYLSVLKGTAGGIDMNLNRWRTQMGVEGPPLTADEIAKLPKIKVAGRDAALLEAAGAYQGMSGAPQANSMLLGAMADVDGETAFVKMVGPEATVRANRDKFIAFCESLR